MVNEKAVNAFNAAMDEREKKMSADLDAQLAARPTAGAAPSLEEKFAPKPAATDWLAERFGQAGQQRERLNCGMYEDEDHEDDRYRAEPRARAIMGNLLFEASKKFDYEPKIRDFIERLDSGDLKKTLWNAIVEKLGKDGPNAGIRKIVVAEIKRLWKNSPPSPSDRLNTLFLSLDAAPTDAEVARIQRVGERVAKTMQNSHGGYRAGIWGLLISDKTSPGSIKTAKLVLEAVEPIDRLTDGELAEKIKAFLAK